MKNVNTKKLAIASVFCAVAVVGSLFSFPVFGSKCAPVQHMVNILCAVLLSPAYGVGAAFVASLIRNLLGLGSLMAFPGSMFGALLCGIVYKKTHNILGHADRRSARHGDTGRPVRLSRGDTFHGSEHRERRVLCLHSAVPGIHGGGCRHFGHNHL